jgi:hypothetical protein
MPNYNKNRITTNNLLNPTKREIKNWNSDFRTSDGPNTSSFVDLSDLAIPYDSHYTSRIVLPADATDFELNYGLLDETTFLLVKVTYNGNYDKDINLGEDSFDPLYYYEPSTYNINFYYDGNSGITYPIGRLLILNGSFTHKLEKIYFNNPLGYDVVLDVFHANILAPIPIPQSSAVTISNLYYSDVITNQVVCTNSGITGSTTGSTEFIISEYKIVLTGYTIIQYHVPYNTILNIQKDTYNIYLSTTTIFYTLKFLTDSDCNSAYSRIIFASQSNTCRYLTDYLAFSNGSVVDCL